MREPAPTENSYLLIETDKLAEFMKHAYLSSLRDWSGFAHHIPSSKRLGYYQLSLRDKESMDLNSPTVSRWRGDPAATTGM